MVMNGGPQMHHQKAPMLSKEWGEGQSAFMPVDHTICCTLLLK
jgi:hypothetical protein